MCLIAFALNKHPEYPFILIANRDEFYSRPTETAHFWPEHKNMLAGRDLQAGGTWLGITTNGRFAALTNYRDIKNIDPKAQSRGELVTGFLMSDKFPDDYLRGLKNSPVKYNGYNLLTWFDKRVHHFSNYQGSVNELSGGIHGLSNALLNTSWPKTEKVKQDFEQSIKGTINPDQFFEILSDQSTAPDEQLPLTGLSYDLEKAVSAVCIRTENYGTRSSTVVLINKFGEVTFIEKTHPVGGNAGETKTFNFPLK